MKYEIWNMTYEIQNINIKYEIYKKYNRALKTWEKKKPTQMNKKKTKKSHNHKLKNWWYLKIKMVFFLYCTYVRTYRSCPTGSMFLSRPTVPMRRHRCNHILYGCVGVCVIVCVCFCSCIKWEKKLMYLYVCRCVLFCSALCCYWH